MKEHWLVRDLRACALKPDTRSELTRAHFRAAVCKTRSDAAAWMREHAPPPPPCFSGEQQWFEWLAMARECDDHESRPERHVYIGEQKRRVFNYEVDFCSDCSADHRRRMRAQGLCDPEHLRRQAEQSSSATSTTIDDFPMVNRLQKGARAERELFELLTADLGLAQPMRRALGQAREGGSDAIDHGLPWSIEVKNQVKLRLRPWWHQTLVQAAREGRRPILFFRRRREYGQDRRAAWSAIVPIDALPENLTPVIEGAILGRRTDYATALRILARSV